MIKYGYTILYVEEVIKTVAFYESAFGLSQKFITPENDYAEMTTGETTLAFASFKLGESNVKNGFIPSTKASKPFGIELVMVTDNVQQAMNDAVKAGASVEAEPVEKPWGQTVGYVRDINGFLIEVCTPIHS
jgi:uncharacterized glyoxalase superfamily protein PhnB